MTQLKKDPLLAIAATLIRAMQVFAIIGIAALFGGGVAVLFWQDSLLAGLATAYPDISNGFPYLLTAFLFSILPLLALFWLQLSRLGAIVGTVEEGNPFVRVNGARLRFIAMLIFVQQFAVLLIMPLISAMQYAAGRYAGSSSDDFQSIDFEISLTALLVALLLVILGRLFEQGADMREDLEGTV